VQIEIRFGVIYDRVRIGADGKVSGQSSDPKQRLVEPTTENRVCEGPLGALLLVRTASGEAGTEAVAGRILMMGEIISRMTVVEIINVITSTNWRGELHVCGPRGKRILSIDQGALKHSQTQLDSERIGELMVGAGVLDRKDLEHYLPQKAKDRRIGQLLVERKLLTDAELFKQLQRQAETIFYSSLLVESGHYWFIATPENAPAPPTTIHVPVQALLMEGVQRIDEMALYRERIPHNRFFPAASETRPNRPASLETSTLALLELCDGTRSIDELARATSLGEFPTLKIIYGLLRTGHLQLLTGPTLDTKAAERLIRLFNDIMRDIFLAVATFGSMDNARRSISNWLAGAPQAQLLGATIDVDGTLNPQAVVRRLEEQAQTNDPLRALHQALHELIAYALFIASNGLPRHEEQSLSREVNHRLKLLKL